jgi:branched-chain amino acid transport system ATP-binding protein
MEAELVGLRIHKANILASAVSVNKAVEVARALATSPELLLLDDFVGILLAVRPRDDEFTQRVRENGTTIMYVEHDMKAIMFVVKRINFINLGKKMVEGKSENIQNDLSVIEAYLGKSDFGGKKRA